MSELESPPPVDGDNHKNSCNYSVDLSKQFLTYAAAGVAFLVASVLAAPSQVDWLSYTSFSSFGFSMAFGLLFVMSVVGHIAKTSNYDVYTPVLRAFSGLQIFAFVVGIVCLGIVVVRKSSASHQRPMPLSDSTLEITIGPKLLRHTIPLGSSIHIKVTAANEVDVTVQTPPKK